MSELDDLMARLKEKDEIIQLCRKHEISYYLLKDVLDLGRLGFSNEQISCKLAISQSMIVYYVKTIRSMPQADAEKLNKYLQKAPKEQYEGYMG